MKKPNKCCDIGTYECVIPMPIRGRVQGIDYCVSDIVAALNAAAITTTASCCGHGKQLGFVLLEDGRWILICRDKEHFQLVANALADGECPMGDDRRAGLDVDQ
jgi:hypothetical protein